MLVFVIREIREGRSAFKKEQEEYRGFTVAENYGIMRKN